jgi:hypothetical protein
MYILVTLNPDQGTDLGPNFTLTSNIGSLSPATATLTQLLAGVTVRADEGVSSIVITSQGICTNSITLGVLPPTTTTTTSSTTTTTTTNTDCLLAGGTVKKAPYVYYPNRFIFGNLSGSGTNNICLGPTTTVYGSVPVGIFDMPEFLFLDPCGLVPFTQYPYVRDSLFGLPSSIYNYNTSTGAVGSYVSSCL